MGFTATKFSNVAACFFVWVQCAYIAQIIALPMGTIAHDAAGAVQMVIAVWLQCDYSVVAMWLQCGCSVIAVHVWLQCGCSVVALQ